MARGPVETAAPETLAALGFCAARAARGCCVQRGWPLPAMDLRHRAMTDSTGAKRELERESAPSPCGAYEPGVLQRLAAFGAQLGSEADAAARIRLATAFGTQLVRAQFGTFWCETPDSRSERYEMCRSTGVVPEALALPAPGVEAALLIPAFEDQRPRRSGDITRDVSALRGALRPAPGALTDGPTLRSVLTAPIRSLQGRALGGLVLGHAAADWFDELDEQALAVLAAMLGSALDNAGLLETLNCQEGELRSAERHYQLLLEANKELEAFCHTVAHELRAPLRHIRGFADLLQETAAPQLDESARRHVTTIKGAAAGAVNMIDGLLSFSRSGRTPISKRRVSLSSLVIDVAREITAENRSRRIRWKIGALPTVHGDARLLRVVLVNLIGNAVKYTRERPLAQIEVGAQRRDGEHEVWVRDNGVGFDRQYADKLFDIFQRLHGERFEGSGIGLASVWRIIERHGGRVWAESERGRGASFYFTLPTESAASAAQRR